MSEIRVLLADDQALVRDGFRAIIDREPDLEVIAEAADGVEAVELGERLHPDVVLMDIRMPIMDGVEATRRIRASDRPDHDVPIFAMTANTFAADRKKCYDAGMSGYIPKPIDLETITHVLEEETGE